jgi:hypothetical protein
MDWEMAANISTTLTMVVAIPATGFALFQLLEMKRGSKLSAFIAVWNFLQEEHVREARGILIALAKKKKNFEIWTPEERDAADLALQRYNSVAILVRNRLIPVSFVLQWEHSLILCWEAAQPLVIQYRTERGTGYWQQLEDLYNLAVEGKKKNGNEKQDS